MSGQRQKPSDQLANKRGGRGRVLTVVPKSRQVPRAPAGLGSYARKVWAEFWRSKVSQAVTGEESYDALREWIGLIDEREKLKAILKRAPFVKGAQGRLIRNPLHSRLREIEAQVWRFREHFGMSPLSQFRLQLTFAESGVSLDELRRRLDEQPETVDGDVLDLDAL